MVISPDEQEAIKTVIALGDRFGYGNLISHLQTAWAKMLMDKYQLPEATARRGTLGDGYPFQMQEDLIERGEWDENRYRK